MKLQQSALTLTIGLALSHTTYASPIILDAFNDNTFSGPSSQEVEIGFGINFFGEYWEKTFVNQRGNITFWESFSGFSASDLLSTDMTIIAPFFAQVDLNSQVTFGQGVFEEGGKEYDAFGVNWMNVNPFGGEAENSFQLVLVDRQTDTDEAGDFDIVFNYENIFWESGRNQNSPPLAGFSNPWGNVSNTRSTDTTFFELPGSGEAGAFLNDGPRALAFDSYNSDIEGRYIFEFRGNSDIFAVPEPATFLLLGTGLLGLAFARRRVLNG